QIPLANIGIESHAQKSRQVDVEDEEQQEPQQAQKGSRTRGAEEVSGIRRICSHSSIPKSVFEICNLKSKSDSAHLSLDAPLGGLENAHHAEPGLAVGYRPLAGSNAINKVSDDILQWLGLLHMGRPDIAGAVANEHAAPSFRLLGNADAPVVNLDRLPEVEVVINEAFFAAADDEVPHLDRAMPVDMKGSEQAVAEIQVEISDVLLVGPGMAASHGRHAARQTAQQKIDNGQIVRGQVPEHVDIVLHQAQVDT